MLELSKLYKVQTKTVHGTREIQSESWKWEDFLYVSSFTIIFLWSQKSWGGGGVQKCFIYIEMASGDASLMCSVNVLTNPATAKCLGVQVVVDPPLWKTLGPDVKVNLVQCYTNTHLLIIHAHAHTPLGPMLGPRRFWTKVFQGKNFF